MSVSTRPTDEQSSADTNEDVAPGLDDRGPPVPPVASQLEETRAGDFSDKPAVPASLVKTMAYAAGDVIANKYRLTKILGEGGMGAVWLARNLALEIDVAIKLIRHDYANAEGAMRLLQEARAAARIGHPCIVRVFDFGTTERDDPFIVMEVLQGESLAETIKRKGRLSAISAIRTLLPVAGALAAAHGKGIVHRDLKPDNIRLVTDDRGAVIPKVVDFGIAKLHHDDTPRETTQAGVILGSPHYMSPEQACGRSDVDHRTDVWAFTVMLYEVIAGVRPFEGPNYNALISSILVFQPAPWDQHDIHEPELWTVIEKGLAKEQQDRWQTMQEYGEALAMWAAQRDVETDAAGNSLRAHWLAAAVQRPLSEFPPANVVVGEGVGGSGGGGRGRMISEREIRVRMASIPELFVPELVIPPLVETNPNVASDDSAREQAQETESDDAVPPAQPSPLPIETTPDKPTTDRRLPAVLLIGVVALAVGALAAGAIILGSNDDGRQTDPLAAPRPSGANQPEDKLSAAAANPPAPSASAEPEAGAVVPAASVMSSAAGSSSAEAPSSTASTRSTAHVGVPKPSGKPSIVPPPIPTDPNF